MKNTFQSRLSLVGALILFALVFSSGVNAEKTNSELWKELKTMMQEERFDSLSQIYWEDQKFYSQTEAEKWLPIWEQILLAGDLAQSVINWTIFVGAPMENLKDSKGEIVEKLKDAFLEECKKKGHFEFWEFWEIIRSLSDNAMLFNICGVQRFCYDVTDPQNSLYRLGLYEKAMALALIFNKREDFERFKNGFFNLYVKSMQENYERNSISSMSSGAYKRDMNEYAKKILEKYEKRMSQEEVERLKKFYAEHTPTICTNFLRKVKEPSTNKADQK